MIAIYEKLGTGAYRLLLLCQKSQLFWQ